MPFRCLDAFRTAERRRGLVMVPRVLGDVPRVYKIKGQRSSPPLGFFIPPFLLSLSCSNHRLLHFRHTLIKSSTRRVYRHHPHLGPDQVLTGSLRHSVPLLQHPTAPLLAIRPPFNMSDIDYDKIQRRAVCAFSPLSCLFFVVVRCLELCLSCLDLFWWVFSCGGVRSRSGAPPCQSAQ